jgi:hypothetical protein
MRLEGQADAPATRVKLNVGGRHFETTVGTLTRGGAQNFFSALLQHAERSEEALFIDRDGETFGPLLNFLRTGELIIPPGVSETSLRLEADYYCIALRRPGKTRPSAPPQPTKTDAHPNPFRAQLASARARQ